MKTSTTRIVPHSLSYCAAGFCLLVTLLANNAKAASVYWDNNGASAATAGPWDTTNKYWANTSALTASTGIFTNNNYAIFAAGSTAISSLTITVPGTVICEGLGAGTTSTGAASGAPVTNLVFNGAGSISLPSGAWPFECGNLLNSASVPQNNVIINVPVTGAGGIIQHNEGALYLYGNNTYAGGTAATGGQVLYYNNNNSFGTGPISTSGGSTSFVTTNGSIYIVTLTNAFNINSGTAIVNFGDGNTICSGPWTLGVTPQLKNNGVGTPLTISGPISGAFGLELQCDNVGGTITLSSTNSTYTGQTLIGYLAAGTVTSVSVSSINSVANPPQQASSSLGVPSSVANGTITMGYGAWPGELIYTGAGETSDRIINLVGTTGGATVEMDGAGPLILTSGITVSTNGAKTITLQGSSTASNIFSGAIVNSSSGATSVTKAQAGTWVLAGANTYSGTTTISNGVLSVTNIGDSGVSCIGTGPATLAGGTLAYNGPGDTTARTFNGVSGSTSTLIVPTNITVNLNGALTGTAKWTLTVTGGGTLVVGGALNDAYCGMNINNSTVVLDKSAGSALGSTTTVGVGGTLQLSGAGYGAEIYSGSTTPLTVSSGGVFDLNGQNNTIYSLNLAGTGINGNGALINSASSSSSVLTGPITLTAATTIGGTTSLGNITLQGAISCSGYLTSLTYSGQGMLTLDGINTYTGGTIINAGTLDGSISGSIPGNVTVNGTGILELDDPNAMAPTAVVTLPASASTNMYLNFSGTETIASLVIGSTPQPAGTYGAIGNTSATYQSAAFTGNGVLNVAQTYWDANGTDASSQSTANGGGSGSWDNSSTDWWITGPPDTNWINNSAAYFAGTAGIVTLNASLVADALVFITPGYVITNTDGVSTLTLAGFTPTITVPSGTPTTISCDLTGGGSLAGLTASGPGTLVLSGNNTYAGGTVISGGTTVSVNAISDSSPTALGLPLTMGTVAGAGAGLAFTGASGLTANNVVINGTSPNTLTVPTGSTLEIDGQIKTGTISAVPGITYTGGGTLYMGGNSDDNSGLTMAVATGTVIINKTTTSTAHGLGGGASSVGTGTVGNSAELQLAGSGNNDLYSGCILTVNSPDGLLDLNGQSDNMSTLTLAGAGPSGTGALINSAVSTTSGLTNGASGVVLAGNTTIGGPGNITLISKVSGGYSLTYAGTGTLGLSGANIYTGGTIINSGGTVQLNATGAAGPGTIADSGVLIVNQGNSMLSNTISGGSSSVMTVDLSTGNEWLLDNLSQFSGTLNVNVGTTSQQLVFGNGSAYTTVINANAIWQINAGADVDFNVLQTNPATVNLHGPALSTAAYGALRLDESVQSGNVILNAYSSLGNGSTAGASTISGVISDGGNNYGITKLGANTVVLSGVNTYAGNTTNNGGTLSIGGSGSLGSGAYAGAIAITNNAIFNYASSAAQTLSGVISGSGVLMQSGPGKLTLTGTNAYTGGTVTTNGGTLTLGGSGSLGSGTYATNIINNGAFAYASSVAQTLSGTISGTGSLTQSGPGKLTLSAVNSYTGGTVITNGSTLALASTGSINTTPSLSITAGATFDVSAYALSYTLGSGATVRANGTGTTVGTTAATIKGGSSATVNLAGPLSLTFTPLAFTGDTTHPALYVSQGTVNFSGSALTVNNAAATPLGIGTYSLVQQASGTPSASFTNITVTGTGLAPNTAAGLAVSGGSLNLVVTNAVVPVPVINSVTLSGGNLIFGGTNGTDSGTYYVLTSTNLALPLTNWAIIATNSFDANGTFSVTNATGTGTGFFIIRH